MVGAERFELPTLCFVGKCSIQLSYAPILFILPNHGGCRTELDDLVRIQLAKGADLTKEKLWQELLKNYNEPRRMRPLNLQPYPA